MEKVEKEQWIKLYEKLDTLYELAPWEYFTSKDNIAIIDSETKKVYYSIILGDSGKLPGILLISEDDILEFRKTMEEEYPLLQMMNYQTGYMVSYPTADKLSDLDRIIPKEVGISFKDICIKIDYYSVGYFPTILDYTQCIQLHRLIDQFLPIFELAANDRLNFPIPHNQMLVRYHDEETHQFLTKALPLVLPDAKPLEEIKLTLIKPKKVKTVYEVEVYKHFPMAIGEFYEENRYRLPHYIAIAEHKAGKMIDFKLLKEQGEEYQKVFTKKIKDFFTTEGIPQKLMVRDEKEASAFRYLEKRYGIEIEISPKLEVIDAFVTGVIQENKTC